MYDLSIQLFCVFTPYLFAFNYICTIFFVESHHCIFMKYYFKAMEKEIIIGNNLSDITHITHFIQEMGNSLQVPSDVIMSISLALEEAIVNVIKYAYPSGEQHEIRLKINVSPQGLHFSLIDNGNSFDITKKEDKWTASALEQHFVDSLGICLIYRIMDEVSYQSKEGQNVLSMRKRINVEMGAEKTMKMNMCKIEGITIVTLEGRLDTVNAREFETGIQSLLEDEKPDVIINCENLSYISSSGIRSLISLQKSVMKHEGSLFMEAMTPDIHKIFEMTGCSSIFSIR